MKLESYNEAIKEHIKDKSNYICYTIDNNTEFQYIGIYNLLDELIKRIKECDDIKKIETYVFLYLKLYEKIHI